MPSNKVALPSFEPLSVSVDYFTCTAKIGTRALSLYYRMQGEIEKKQAAGEPRKGWKAHGYEGWSTGGISIGRRLDGTIVRLSGFDAEFYWRSCLAQSDNVSRIDLSATGISAHPDFPVAWAARSDFLRWCKSGHRKIKYHYHDTGPDGDSFELGSRSSDFFGRIYDKYRESGAAWPAGSWRWELEIKGDQAMAVAQTLYSRDERRSHIVGQVMLWFRDRGIQVPWGAASHQWRYKAEKDDGKLASQMEWLRTSVAPTCQHLAGFVGEDEVLQALGLSASISVKPDVSRETRQEVKELWQRVLSSGASSEVTSPPVSG